MTRIRTLYSQTGYDIITCRDCGQTLIRGHYPIPFDLIYQSIRRHLCSVASSASSEATVPIRTELSPSESRDGHDPVASTLPTESRSAVDAPSPA